MLAHPIADTVPQEHSGPRNTTALHGAVPVSGAFAIHFAAYTVGRLTLRQRAHLRVWPFVVVGLAVASAAALYVWRSAHADPKRFAAVVEGRLYRCGTVSPTQLERLCREYGIRRVISLLNPDAPESVAEREAAARLGLEWHNIPLPGNGASAPAERDRIRTLLLDENAGPTLVHCAAGANRTGLAIGMYRLHRQGWSAAQVLEEMRRFGFEDEPHHQNLRDALAAEAALAAGATSQPAATSPGRRP